MENQFDIHKNHKFEWIYTQGVGKIKVTDIAYHRNGVRGNGFFVVTFINKDGNRNMHMVATIFEGIGDIAVLNVDLLAEGNIQFAENSWRGDNFEPELRSEIEKWKDEVWGKVKTAEQEASPSDKLAAATIF